MNHFPTARTEADATRPAFDGPLCNSPGNRELYAIRLGLVALGDQIEEFSNRHGSGCGCGICTAPPELGASAAAAQVFDSRRGKLAETLTAVRWSMRLAEGHIDNEYTMPDNMHEPPPTPAADPLVAWHQIRRLIVQANELADAWLEAHADCRTCHVCEDKEFDGRGDLQAIAWQLNLAGDVMSNFPDPAGRSTLRERVARIAAAEAARQSDGDDAPAVVVAADR